MHASPRRAAHERASICRSNRAVAADCVPLFWFPVGETGKHFRVMPCGVVYCRPGTPRASVATSAGVVTDVAPARSPLASNGGPVRLCPRTRQASVANASLGHCTVGLSYRSIQSSIRLLLRASPGRCFSTEALIISVPDPRPCLSLFLRLAPSLVEEQSPSTSSPSLHHLLLSRPWATGRGLPVLVHGFADIGGRWLSCSSTGYGVCCRCHKSIMHRSIASDPCMHTVGHLRSIDSCDWSTARFSALYFVFCTGLPPPFFCGFEIHLGQEQWMSILFFDIS